MNTMQQEFDAVVAHLYKQGKPAKSYYEDGTLKQCFYRAGSLSCAVGCRIPDEVYSPRMDSSAGDTDVGTLIARFGHVLPPEIEEYEDMFSHLQYVHDTCLLGEDKNFDLVELEQKLSRVARDFRLTFTKPEVNNG